MFQSHYDKLAHLLFIDVFNKQADIKRGEKSNVILGAMIVKVIN